MSASNNTCPPVAMTPKVWCNTEISDILSKATTGLLIIPRFKVFSELHIKFLEQVNGATHYTAGNLPMRQTAFFTKTGILVSTSAFTSILAIASMVVTFSLPYCWRPGTHEASGMEDAFNTARHVPDGTTKYVNRYANLPTFKSVMEDICAGGTFASWFEFYVDVMGVESQGQRCAQTYRAYWQGVDFNTGVATFKIDPSDIWNSCLPPLRQTFLKFGNSKASTPGSTVHAIYDSKVTGPLTFNTGVVSNNAGLTRDGGVTYEVITTTIPVAEGAEGGPILNQCGEVVGIITGRTRNGYAVGIASVFAEPIINMLVKAACIPDCTPYVHYVRVWGVRAFRHGTLDMQYHTATAADINQAFLRVFTGSDPCGACHGDGFGGDCAACCQGSDYWRERFYNYNNCQIDRSVRGVIIDTEPCGLLADAVEKCDIQNPNYGPNIVRYTSLERGDKITHINGREIGALPHQTTPENIFYELLACTCVDITFSKESELYTQPHVISVRLEDNLMWIGDFLPMVGPSLHLDVAAISLSNIQFNSDVSSLVQLMQAINTHFNMVRWFVTAMPQVYRASFYSNQENMMTRLNEWIAVLMSPKALSCGMDGAVVPTPLSINLTMSQLSRALVSWIAVPSLEPCVVPVTFYDYIGSVPSPNSACAFEQTIPNYLGMIGHQIADYLQAGCTPTPTGGPLPPVAVPAMR